jgi:hypothetical protein
MDFQLTFGELFLLGFGEKKSKGNRESTKVYLKAMELNFEVWVSL